MDVCESQSQQDSPAIAHHIGSITFMANLHPHIFTTKKL